MNHIENIEIKNFKSIKHASIKDCRRVNVFIGYPNVGKSSILEAMSLFSVNKEGINLNDFVRVEKLTTFFFDGHIENDVEIIINSIERIQANYSGGLLNIKNEFDREKYGFENIDNTKSFISGKLEASEMCLYSITDSGNINGFRGNNGIQFHNANQSTKILKYDFKKGIKFNSEKGWQFFHPFGENIFSVISENKIIQKEVEKLFLPYNLELLFDTRQQVFTILKRTQSGIFTIPYELVADTLQRMIFYKTAVMSNKESILLFEEPEAHMFPPYISKFTSEVTYDENGNQFFIATHSPFVINDFMENLKNDELAIFTVGYDKETGETLIRKMDDDEMHEIYQYGVDFFLNLENFLPHAKQQ